MLNKTFSTPVLTSALFTPNKEMICNFRNDVDPTNINKSASGFIDDINYEEILKKVPNTEHYLPLVVRAVSAGEYYGPNDKWDFFPEQELKDHYETFLTAHVFFNHDNKDVRKACGPVYDAYYDTKMHCVILVMAVDLSKEGDTAKAVKNGYLTDVSMGCGAGYVSCPLCKTIAYKPTMRCEHLKNNLGQIIDNQLIYEITHKPKFYDISLVLNGADRTAKIYHVIQKAASLLPYCNTHQEKPQEAINLKPKKLSQKELNLAIRKEAVASYLNSITEPIQKTSYELLKTKKEASLPVLQNLHNLIQTLNPNKSEMHITISLAKKGRNGTFLTPNELHTLLRGKPLEADYEKPNPDLWLNPGETLLDILDEPFKPHVDVFRAVRKVKPWAISSITPEDEIETGINIPDILSQLIPTVPGTKNIFPSTDPTGFKRLYQTYIILLPSFSDPKNLTEEEIKELEGSLMPDETKLEHLAKDSIKVKVSNQSNDINKEAGILRRTIIGTPLIYGLSGYYNGKEQEGYPLNPLEQTVAAAPIAYTVANTLYGGKLMKALLSPLMKAKGLLTRASKLASYNYQEEDEVLTKIASLTQDQALQSEGSNFTHSFVKAASVATFDNDSNLSKAARDSFLQIVDTAKFENNDAEDGVYETYKAAMEEYGEEITKEAFLMPAALPFDFATSLNPVKAVLNNSMYGLAILGAVGAAKGIGSLLDKQKKKRAEILRKKYQMLTSKAVTDSTESPLSDLTPPETSLVGPSNGIPDLSFYDSLDGF